MVERRYNTRTGVSFNTDKDMLTQFKEICKKEDKDFSMKINELMREEIIKKELGRTNPISVAYNSSTGVIQLDKRQAFIQMFGNFSNIKEGFKYLKDSQLTLDDIEEINRENMNLQESLRHYRANIITR